MSEEIEYPSKERERAKVNVKVSAEVNTYLHDLYNQIQYEFCEQYEDEIKDLKKEIDRLNNIIDTMLEFSFFKEECPLNFGFVDKKEEKALDVFYEDNYCEVNCNDIYKKCWLKYFEKLQELKEDK